MLQSAGDDSEWCLTVALAVKVLSSAPAVLHLHDLSSAAQHIMVRGLDRGSEARVHAH